MNCFLHQKSPALRTRSWAKGPLLGAHTLSIMLLASCAAPPPPAPPGPRWDALPAGTVTSPEAAHRYWLWLERSLPAPEAFQELLSAATLPVSTHGGGARRRILFDGSRCTLNAINTAPEEEERAAQESCSEELRSQLGSNRYALSCSGGEQLDVFVAAQNLASTLADKLQGVAFHRGRGVCERAPRLTQFRPSETISVRSAPLGEGAQVLYTVGLNAFGQPELVIAPVPAARVEVGKGVLLTFATEALTGEALQVGRRLEGRAASAILVAQSSYEAQRPHAAWGAWRPTAESLFMVSPEAEAGDADAQRQFVLRMTLP